MGEHTVRDILKRRSDDTQRVIRRRRDRATKRTQIRRKSFGFLIVMVAIIVTLLGAVVYAGWLTDRVTDRFAADQRINRVDRRSLTLNLKSTSQFLPNTLLAVIDPDFYNDPNVTVSPLTARLVRLYFPNASSPAVTVMSIALQFAYSRTDILKTYINDVVLGVINHEPIRGFAAASEVYFGKPFAQLQPQDVALLTALTLDPGSFDPRARPAQALAMRNAVLQMDVQQGVLSQAQVDALKKAPLNVGF